MFFDSSPYLSTFDNYPLNDALTSIAQGLAEGWAAYGRKDAVVLFVVQDGERNVFDQWALQYELMERYVPFPTIRRLQERKGGLRWCDDDRSCLLMRLGVREGRGVRQGGTEKRSCRVKR